ncbi:F-box domain protein [Ceratocystis lukuohia]
MAQPVLDALADALQNLNMLTDQLQTIANTQLGDSPDRADRPITMAAAVEAGAGETRTPATATARATSTTTETETASQPESHSNRLLERDPHESFTYPEAQQQSQLASVPVELLLQILEYMEPADLMMLSWTSQIFYRLCRSDNVWLPRIQINVPHTKVSKLPPGFTNFFELWRALRDQWFVARHKIWFSDAETTGKLIVSRYDPWRGCIEAYQVVAVNKARDHDPIIGVENVAIHPFDPHVSLHKDTSIITLRASDARHPNRDVSRFEREIPMLRSGSVESFASSFVAARPASILQEQKSHQNSPSGTVWPPPSIPMPCEQSTLGVAPAMYPATAREVGDSSCIPNSHREASQYTFHLRSWLHMSNTVHPLSIPSAVGPGYHSTMNASSMLGEALTTYATLAPELYMPTPTRPFRGLWVGDYSGHGCEFVLIVQPDLPEVSDLELRLVRQDGEEEEIWQKRRLEARIYRGPLMAVKLTGDVNIPRGKFTFKVSDLDTRGFVGRSIELGFNNARVVRCLGQIAEPLYTSPTFELGELILISENELAYHWVDFKEIHFFKRFDVDELLKQ